MRDIYKDRKSAERNSSVLEMIRLRSRLFLLRGNVYIRKFRGGQTKSSVVGEKDLE